MAFSLSRCPGGLIRPRASGSRHGIVALPFPRRGATFAGAIFGADTMDDHLCPVCGNYGISVRDKLRLRLFGQVLTCSACGVRLTVDYWQSVISLVPLLVMLGIGFLLNSALGLAVCLAIGLAASWLWSIRYVPLVPIGRGPRRR
jgi:predicted RNA-binding Zn-ribbon protein involved in translation (DUF1610 family)